MPRGITHGLGRLAWGLGNLVVLVGVCSAGLILIAGSEAGLVYLVGRFPGVRAISWVIGVFAAYGLGRAIFRQLRRSRPSRTATSSEDTPE
jgi:hypothetical protein